LDFERTMPGSTEVTVGLEPNKDVPMTHKLTVPLYSHYSKHSNGVMHDTVTFWVLPVCCISPKKISDIFSSNSSTSIGVESFLAEVFPRK